MAVRRVALGTASVVGGAALAAHLTRPRAGAALIRAAFELDGRRLSAELARHRPTNVHTLLGARYRDGDDAALLDVHSPDDGGDALPTLVWTHGGAGLSGSRRDAAGYFARIAAEGYTVVALDYRLAPGATYPAAVHDVNDALAHVVANADRYRVDPSRIVLAGDSAGAQITSQVATLVTVPSYAERLGLTPALAPGQLRGVVLCCGYYDLDTFLDRGELAPVPLRWGVRTMLHAYTGTRDRSAPAFDEMSTLRHVTAEFPAAFLTGGDADPLTDVHSRPLADRLEELGVDVTRVFFDGDPGPALGHEYQFHLDLPEATATLDRLVGFLAAGTA